MISGDSFSRVSVTCPHGKVDTPKLCDPNVRMRASTRAYSGPYIDGRPRTQPVIGEEEPCNQGGSVKDGRESLGPAGPAWSS
ncbi:hypothetical protein CRG98_019019 [Punica granatum]|uniref:Uncharacterized protein n=1 Tax=Punica granatum TaxID=22663 RepID=A0A2I0JXG7_PUNGR|nr:hypothetical protein CRG98_019019 [Punica granatum]